jgi:hypothetical protein
VTEPCRPPTKTELMAALGGLVPGRALGHAIPALRRVTPKEIAAETELALDDARLAGYLPGQGTLTDQVLAALLLHAGVEW